MAKHGGAPVNYLPQLDGMRIFAVVGVLIAHYVTPAYQGPVPWGVLGVQLFFVLSGFLITGILLDCRENVAQGRATVGFSLRQFYARRFLRIFPLYYVVLAAVFLLPVLRPGYLVAEPEGFLAQARDHWAWHVFYLSNMLFAVKADWHGNISHFWTLAVEEQFYIFWPFLMLLLPTRWLRPAMIGAVTLAVLTRLVAAGLGAHEITVKCLTPANLDTLAFGALLALERRRWSQQGESGLVQGLPRLAAIGGMLAAVLFVGHTAAPESYAMTVVYEGFFKLGLGFLFMWVIHRGAVGFGGIVGRVLEAGPIVYLGRITYGIYIFHNFATFFVSRRLFNLMGDVPRWQYEVVHFFVCSAVTIVAAIISWHLFEGPVNSLKRHFPYAVKKKPEGKEAPAGAGAVMERPAEQMAETAGPGR